MILGYFRAPYLIASRTWQAFLILAVWALVALGVERAAALSDNPKSLPYICAEDQNGNWSLIKANSSGNAITFNYTKCIRRLDKKIQRLSRAGVSAVQKNKRKKIINKRAALSEAYNNCSKKQSGGDPTDSNTVPDPNGRVITITMTPKMRDPQTGALVPTSDAIVQKIKAAYRLWQSVSEAKLNFVYDGFKNFETIDCNQLQDRVHVVLDKPASSTLGEATSYFTQPSTGAFIGGILAIDTTNETSLRLQYIANACGTSLGVKFGSANMASVMSCGSTAWNAFEFLAFSEQDRTELVARHNPAGLYTISGQVSSNSEQYSLVFAVDAVTGNTYTTQANSAGEFKIAILKPGNYQVVAKSHNDILSWVYPVTVSPSWYVSAGVSNNNPAAAAIVSVSDANRHVSNINFPFVEASPPFDFSWSRAANGAVASLGADQLSDMLPSFGRPGHTLTFHAVSYSGDRSFNGDIISIEPVGSDPGFSVLSFDPTTALLRIYVHPNASPGLRLLSARSASGIVQVGDLGLHIIGSKAPSQMNISLANQLLGSFDFNSLNSNYWKE